MLSPLAWIYRGIVGTRNALYDRGLLPTHSLGAETISVGNITTGGTGKTPLVALVAKILAENGEQVCILTRGYGRQNPRTRVLVSDGKEVLVDARTGGDEPVELARKLVGKAVVVADPDRVSAAKWAKERFGITAFILDDGFQHRRVKRDLDIVCIDATAPFGNGRLLPAGRLREPVSNLRRADIVLITRAELADDRSQLQAHVRNHNPDAPIFFGEDRLVRTEPLQDFLAGYAVVKTDITDGGPAVALLPSGSFCGLGNPDAFFSMLRHYGFNLRFEKAFGDHHYYRSAEIEAVENEAKHRGAEILLTTAKDAVKLEGIKFNIPCLVVHTSIYLDESDSFRELILTSS